MKRFGSERVKEQYFIEGHVIKWRGFGIDDQGEVVIHYIVVDEDGNLVGNFSVHRRDIKRREDVVYVAKRSLGLFPEGEDRPSLSLTRAESAEQTDEL